MNLNDKSISSAFSSLTHLCRLRDTNTQSFWSHPLSASTVSNGGLFRSRRHASAILSSLSLRLFHVSLYFYFTSSRLVSFSGGGGERTVRPVKPAELDQTEFDIAGLVLLKRLAQLSNAGLDIVGGRVLERRDLDGAHDEN